MAVSATAVQDDPSVAAYWRGRLTRWGAWQNLGEGQGTGYARPGWQKARSSDEDIETVSFSAVEMGEIADTERLVCVLKRIYPAQNSVVYRAFVQRQIDHFAAVEMRIPENEYVRRIEVAYRVLERLSRAELRRGK